MGQHDEVLTTAPPQGLWRSPGRGPLGAATTLRARGSASTWPPRSDRSLTRRRRADGAAGLCLILTITACADLGGEQRFPASLETYRIDAVVTGPDADGARPWSALDLCTSVPLEPASLGEFAAVFSSGQAVFDVQVEVQLSAWRAPGSKHALASERWCEGSVVSVMPAGTLAAGVLYRATVVEAPVGWDGESLDPQAPWWIEDDDGVAALVFEMPVTPIPGPAPRARPALRLGDLYGDEGPFRADGACGCHTTEGDPAVAHLDLRAPATAWAVLTDPRVRPTGARLVEPGRPEASYLVRKTVRTADGSALSGIPGAPMPPEPAVDVREVAMISAWIADGAEP